MCYCFVFYWKLTWLQTVVFIAFCMLCTLGLNQFRKYVLVIIDFKRFSFCLFTLGFVKLVKKISQCHFF